MTLEWRDILNRAIFGGEVHKERLEAVLEIVDRFPEGAAVEDILRISAASLPRRSLQRYLAILVREGRVNALGKARARRYYSYRAWPETFQETPPAIGGRENVILLSQAALAIQADVHRPTRERRPVGYNRAFLDAYRPNETYYLSEGERKHLAELGKSPDSERPAGTYAREILNRLLIDLSWNSSRLEGNTYSLLETERLLELGEVTEGKRSEEAHMIFNHKIAIEFMVDSAEQLRFDHYTILNLHAYLSYNLLRDPRARGSLRTQPVGIAKSVYRPLAVPQLISECFQELLNKADAIQDPFEQAFFAMVHLPYLQPFMDVNKRVSRLAANISLIRENLCPLSFVDVPEQAYISGLLGVYELNRIELLREVFVWAYERSCSLYLETRQKIGKPDLFRSRYRNLITALVGEIVHGCLDKKAAVVLIRKRASEAMSVETQAKFTEIVETELMGLHEGNVAAFRVNPEQYKAWLKTWR